MECAVTDRVLIPFNGSMVVLTVEQLAEAQAAGSELVAPASVPGSSFEPLVDAETAATQLGVTARLLEDYTRAGIARTTASAASSAIGRRSSRHTSRSEARRRQRIANPSRRFRANGVNDLGGLFPGCFPADQRAKHARSRVSRGYRPNAVRR
jgi:hypothetical protein